MRLHTCPCLMEKLVMGQAVWAVRTRYRDACALVYACGHLLLIRRRLLGRQGARRAGRVRRRGPHSGGRTTCPAWTPARCLVFSPNSLFTIDASLLNERSSPGGIQKSACVATQAARIRS